MFNYNGVVIHRWDWDSHSQAMQERAHLIGGNLRFAGQVADGRGTLVTLCIPLQN